jgi:hypothetical protein
MRVKQSNDSLLGVENLRTEFRSGGSVFAALEPDLAARDPAGRARYQPPGRSNRGNIVFPSD